MRRDQLSGSGRGNELWEVNSPQTQTVWINTRQKFATKQRAIIRRKPLTKYLLLICESKTVNNKAHNRWNRFTARTKVNGSSCLYVQRINLVLTLW